ncbi:MAG: nuclear transport factor 2 family protein [Frateuria sp.]|uniref:YybH family protein n=1 Tax=Frateuria sp. TaxID=2211372 RepID=UPI0017EB815C|nr:nuclear transport factor 2 family protein [Frateuria sp.]NUO71405.1 nuclear transport factor 2 family protein [Frateuria sp.]NUR22771.1 nuclear transport factor 2 family protein [Frateuria sp.]
MRISACAIALGLLLACAAGPLRAAGAADEAAAIRQVMAAQQAAWNRADIDAFMRGYKDAPDTTFVGRSVRKGYRAILESYRRHYAGTAQMGRLTFSDIDVRLLPGAGGEVRYAAVTGRFHLDRTAHGEVAQDDGVYSLLWEKTAQGWKIILDHSS